MDVLSVTIIMETININEETQVYISESFLAKRKERETLWSSALWHGVVSREVTNLSEELPGFLYMLLRVVR
jgi:hypothetical protein